MNILIIDDEINLLRSLKTFLELKGHSVSVCDTEEQGVSIALTKEFDVLLLDLFLEHEDQGFVILEKIKKIRSNLPIVIISGHGSVQSAVKAIQLGAYDFLEKPINTDKLEIILRNALNTGKLSRELSQLKKNWQNNNFIVGESQAMKNVMDEARKIAVVDHSVLIYGENGTGKEVLSRFIYQSSPRCGQPLISVNCAAIPHDLFESQLFGHSKGAFTGAEKDHRGYFEQAHGGTLFLDEVAEIPLALQAKLLRALENHEIQKLGDEKTRKVDVRLITASNRNLREEIQKGTFREDLFFRINQLELNLPALDQRREDIPALVQHLVQQENLKKTLEFTPEAMSYLQNRKYPGNIRELKNLVLRIIVLIQEVKITIEHIISIDNYANVDKEGDIFQSSMPLKVAKLKLEYYYLKQQLDKFSGSIKNTAEALEILPNNLSRRLKELKSHDF